MFGTLVRAHRRRCGLTQEELASRTGIAPRTIRDIESGRVPGPRPSTIRLLADAFELRAAERDRFLTAGAPGGSGPPQPPGPDRAHPTPAQLPPDIAGFAGRAGELDRLTALLPAVAERPTAVVIAAVGGTAGVGKTALAVHWAHQVAARFPDGQLYVNLRGFDSCGQIMTSAEAVRGFLAALGLPGERIPTGLDAQAALYRSLLAGKRVLVLLDNTRDAEHVRPLLPGTPTALAVVTSRNQLTGLVAADGAHPLTLDLLTGEEARELLARRIDPGRVAAEPEAVEEIITVCARLPLALALVAARAATHPGFALTALATELAAASGRAGGLDAGDVLGQVRAVFSWSYTTLSPAAARLFRLLGLHRGPDISAAAAGSLIAAPPAETGPLLAELTRAGLLTEHAPRRYAFHDLLAAYATDLAHSVDPDDERRAATTRLLDHYTHTAYTAERLLDPTREPIRLPLAPPVAGAAPEGHPDDRAALAWLTLEQPQLQAALRLAAGAGFDVHTWQLAWALATFLDRRGNWHELADSWQAAAAAADRLAHPTAAADAHRCLAQACNLLGGYGEADTHLRRALELYAEAGDRVGQADTHRVLAYLWERRNRPDLALDHTRQALARYRAAGHRHGQAKAINGIGWYHALLGEHAQAVTHCQEALTLHQQSGDRHGQAHTWDSLGYAHHHLNRFTQAADCYRHAVTLYRDLGDRYNEADTLNSLGDTHYAAGNPDDARTAWHRAVDILTDLDHPDAGGVRAKLTALDRPAPPPAGPGASPPP